MPAAADRLGRAVVSALGSPPPPTPPSAPATRVAGTLLRPTGGPGPHSEPRGLPTKWSQVRSVRAAHKPSGPPGPSVTLPLLGLPEKCVGRACPGRRRWPRAVRRTAPTRSRSSSIVAFRDTSSMVRVCEPSMVRTWIHISAPGEGAGSAFVYPCAPGAAPHPAAPLPRRLWLSAAGRRARTREED